MDEQRLKVMADRFENLEKAVWERVGMVLSALGEEALNEVELSSLPSLEMYLFARAEGCSSEEAVDFSSHLIALMVLSALATEGPQKLAQGERVIDSLKKSGSIKNLPMLEQSLVEMRVKYAKAAEMLAQMQGKP